MNEIKPVSVTEARWYKGDGERYLSDGRTVRCQGVSKTRLRQERIDQDNLELTSDDVWPELQCTKRAEPGKFACKYHGGLTPGGTPSSYMPYDLREIYLRLKQNPEYISREDEIRQLHAINALLYEEMDEYMGGISAFKTLMKALKELDAGNLTAGRLLVMEAINSSSRQREARDEIRSNIDLINRLTGTQVKTAKELQTMATANQVHAIVDQMTTSFLSSLEKNVHDEAIIRKILQDVSDSRTNVGIPGNAEVLS